MPPLDRTFALEDMKVVAVRVAKNLELDMPRPTNVFFDKHPAVAKRSRCFARSRCHGPGQVCRTFDQAHSLAAAPARSFDKNWIFGIRRFTLPYRNHGNTGFLHDALGFQLVAHSANCFGRGPDEDNAGIQAHQDRKSTRLNSSHVRISYAVFCLKKKKKHNHRVLSTANYTDISLR